MPVGVAPADTAVRCWRQLRDGLLVVHRREHATELIEHLSSRLTRPSEALEQHHGNTGQSVHQILISQALKRFRTIGAAGVVVLELAQERYGSSAPAHEDAHARTMPRDDPGQPPPRGIRQLPGRGDPPPIGTGGPDRTTR